MRLIERYLFRQLLWPTLGATAALGAVMILSETLAQLDVLVNQHQSVAVFTKLIALSLPQAFAIVLPIALFVAALITLNRLHTEQEIVVCFAGGMSRWRVISPAIRLAVYCALISLVINLWVAPWCYRETRAELFRIKTDLVSTLVRDGEFNQPSPGLTIYAQSTDRTGLLHNVFINEDKANGLPTTSASKFGRIVKRSGQPALILNQGSNQQYNAEGVLTFTTFQEYVFDLTPYLNTDEDVHFKDSDRYLHELVFPDLTQILDKKDRKKFLAEASSRLATPLYNIALMALALTGVVGGSFSRTGYGRRIAFVAATAIVLRILGFGAQAACASAPALNLLQYAIPLIPTWIAFRQIFQQRASVFTSIGGGAADLQPLGAT